MEMIKLAMLKSTKMKTRLITTLITCFTLFLFAFSGIADQISNALKTGNTTEIAKYFKSNIDLSILGEDDLYSKEDATRMIGNFLKKHQPSDFKILHQGNSKKGLEYTIGALSTNTGNFRVSFYINNGLIQQLKIDKDE